MTTSVSLTGVGALAEVANRLIDRHLGVRGALEAVRGLGDACLHLARRRTHVRAVDRGPITNSS